MSTQHPDLFAALSAPFEPEEVKQRPQNGRQLHYVTARTVMNRLDAALGPENWWDEYTPHENSVLCRLTIRLPDGALLTKSDAGGYAGMADSGDDDKSGYSDAFKRAAVKLGVARYLYRDGVPSFVTERVPGGDDDAPTPRARAAAPVGGHAPERPPARNGNGTGHPYDRHANGYESPRQPRMSRSAPAVPRTGKELWAWAGDQGVRDELVAWGKRMEFPSKMIDWDPQEVADGHAEALELLNVSRRRN